MRPAPATEVILKNNKGFHFMETFIVLVGSRFIATPQLW
jgi:hypothetical protein